MNREIHVRICGGRGVQFPPATRRLRGDENCSSHMETENNYGIILCLKS